MSVYKFEDRVPQIGDESYIHPQASVLGNVLIGEGCWIGPGARIRGDYGEIVIGSKTSIEDNCVIHARPKENTRIGNFVTVGHGAVIHNAHIDNYAVIGMGSVVSDWAKIGEWSVVGEGAVVPQKQKVPSGRIAVGVPARVLDKKVDEEYKKQWLEFKNFYVDLAKRYKRKLKPFGLNSSGKAGELTKKNH